jgi:hypothetical protein
VTEEDRALPRRRDIEAAIAAHNAADGEPRLPPVAVRLLNAMFAEADVCQRNLDSLVAEVRIGKQHLLQLLRALVEAGFVSRQQATSRRLPNIYRLHLPPLVRR